MRERRVCPEGEVSPLICTEVDWSRSASFTKIERLVLDRAEQQYGYSHAPSPRERVE